MILPAATLPAPEDIRDLILLKERLLMAGFREAHLAASWPDAPTLPVGIVPDVHVTFLGLKIQRGPLGILVTNGA